MDSEYVSVLRKKLEVLKEEKNKKLCEIKRLLTEIEVMQKSAESIIQLLRIEGVPIDSIDMQGLIQESISDLAFAHLNSLSEKHPVHYMDIFNGILASGKSLPGKNPAANLLTHMSRDERFIRVSSGTYGLSEWGIQLPKIRKQKKSRRKPKLIRRINNE